MPKVAEPLEQRFWRQVRKIPGGCWEWTGPVRKDGYGQLTIGSRTDGTRRVVSAYRLRLELEGREIPEGHEADHACNNRLCVRLGKDHVRIVTIAFNRGRHYREKTHCPQGHPYDEENTCWRPSGGRDCRKCHRDQVKQAYRDKNGGLRGQPSRKIRKLTDDQVANILKLYHDGKTQQEIAKQYGVSDAAVRYWIKKNR